MCSPVSLQFKLINKFDETHLHTKNVQKPVDASKSLASLPERNFSVSWFLRNVWRRGWKCLLSKFIIKSTAEPAQSDHPQGMVGWLLNKVDH